MISFRILIPPLFLLALAEGEVSHHVSA
jgi:hypothetical protein